LNKAITYKPKLEHKKIREKEQPHYTDHYTLSPG